MRVPIGKSRVYTERNYFEIRIGARYDSASPTNAQFSPLRAYTHTRVLSHVSTCTGTFYAEGTNISQMIGAIGITFRGTIAARFARSNVRGGKSSSSSKRLTFFCYAAADSVRRKLFGLIIKVWPDAYTIYLIGTKYLSLSLSHRGDIFRPSKKGEKTRARGPRSTREKHPRGEPLPTRSHKN